MVREDIRRVGKEVWGEISEGFTKGKRFLRKRARAQPRVKGTAPLAFAVVPPQYYQPIQKPRLVKRKMRRRRR